MSYGQPSVPLPETAIGGQARASAAPSGVENGAEHPNGAVEAPDWLPAESWTVVGPPEEAAVAAAPAPDEVPSPVTPAAAAPTTPAFRVRDLVSTERMVVVAMFLVCAIVAGQWWWSHTR